MRRGVLRPVMLVALLSACTSVPATVGPARASDPIRLRITTPPTRGNAKVSPNTDGTFGFAISGIAAGLGPSQQILLWVRSVQPRSGTPGWYLQRPPENGIATSAKGKWQGRGQIGNAQWPPQAGHTFDIAITVVDRAVAEALFSTEAVVTKEVLPVGAQAKSLGVRVQR